MRYLGLMLSGLLCVLAIARGAQAQNDSCPIVEAPAKFDFLSDKSDAKGRPTNIGIVPHGFVSVSASVVHGVDVSKWQSDANFIRIWECGGRFAYIRLSAGENPDNELEYRQYWANARNVNLMVGGYHNLVISDANVPASSLSKSDLDQLREQNLASAVRQAQLFLARLKEVLTLDPTQTPDNVRGKVGLPYLPIVVDAMLRPQSRGRDADRLAIGNIYGDVLCRWIETVRAYPATAEQPVVLFTSPSGYHDYGLRRAPCLTAIPIWVSYHAMDGDRPSFAVSDGDVGNVVAGELCLAPDGTNRCVMQQYTSYGGFALFQKDKGLDLDRFFGTEEELHSWLQNASGGGKE